MKKIRKRVQKPKLPKMAVADYACPNCKKENTIRLIDEQGKVIFNKFTQCVVCEKFYYMSVLNDGKIVWHHNELVLEPDGKTYKSKVGSRTTSDQAIL